MRGLARAGPANGNNRTGAGGSSGATPLPRRVDLPIREMKSFEQRKKRREVMLSQSIDAHTLPFLRDSLNKTSELPLAEALQP